MDRYDREGRTRDAQSCIMLMRFNIMGTYQKRPIIKTIIYTQSQKLPTEVPKNLLF